MAQRESTTLRALVEEGLRRVLGDRRTRGAFRLRPVAFGGDGLHPDVGEGDWDAVRRRTYEGRGE